MLSTIATTINSDKTPETVDTFGRVNSHKCHLIPFVPGYFRPCSSADRKACEHAAGSRFFNGCSGVGSRRT